MADFTEVRKSCSALKFVLPDHVFGITQSNFERLDALHHDSKFFIAFERGTLSRLTMPLHQFIIDCQGKQVASINRDYQRDLIEKWLLSDENTTSDKSEFGKELKRHIRSRSHDGKLHELVFAYDMSKRGIIENLEAWDSNSPDIILNQHGCRYLMEIKYIGVEDLIMKSQVGKRGCSFSPRKIANYIVFRLCEASLQLNKFTEAGQKIAVIIIDKRTWQLFELATKHGYFSFNNPEIADGDLLLNELIQGKSDSKQVRYRDIFLNFKNYLSYSDGFCVFVAESFEYELKFHTGIDLFH